MPDKLSYRSYFAILFTIQLSLLPLTFCFSQTILPPSLLWSGESEKLIVSREDPWATPAELVDFTTTPNYETTMDWLKKLADASDLISLKTIGSSARLRPIQMVIASRDPAMHQGQFRSTDRLNVLVQAGIHSGEIDGKDAGLMLLRDIVFGGKDSLLDRVNLLFIPILSVDAHEMASPANRPNQRGPENMGWRTNARNLNLNRDYTKLETEELRAALYVINAYTPALYVDIHVTDGADYQYDITYGRPAANTYSKSISAWLRNTFAPKVDSSLIANGHFPGPLIFTFRGDDFSKGIIKYAMPLRFSDGYGDARHLPSILVENHSLKPYRQRVLGTYIFLEQMLRTVALNGHELEQAILDDQAYRPDSLNLNWAPGKNQSDSIDLLLIRHETIHSDITGNDYPRWLGEPIRQRVPYIRMEDPVNIVKVPKAYYLPVEWVEVIRKLSGHGIKMEIVTTDTMPELSYSYVESYALESVPNEGRIRFKDCTFSEKILSRLLPRGSVRIPTDQLLGRLVVLLLEPGGPDSFFQWGYFNSILSRTEYIEPYVMEPLILEMLAADPALRVLFEQKKATDPAFASNGQAIYEWFYAQTPYFDSNWKLIPIGREF